MQSFFNLFAAKSIYGNSAGAQKSLNSQLSTEDYITCSFSVSAKLRCTVIVITHVNGWGPMMTIIIAVIAC